MESNKVTLGIEESFSESLKDAELINMVSNIAELSIDNLIDDGTFRDIPILGTMVGVIKIGASIKDKLFLKKILSFINELKDIPPEKRRKMIDSIDNSKDHRLKVGEKLLYIIDTCADYENSEITAKFFKAFLEGKITYDDFLRGANIIDKTANYDLNWFLKNARDYMPIEDAGNLISSGLFDLHYEPVNVRVMEEDDYKKLRDGGDKYKTDVDGGETSVVISHIGNIILEVLGGKTKQVLKQLL